MSEFELPDDEAVADKRRYVEAQRKMQRRLDAELDHLPPGDHRLVDGEWVRRTIVLTAPRGLADRIRDDARHRGVAMSHLLLGCYLFAIGEGNNRHPSNLYMVDRTKTADHLDFAIWCHFLSLI
jgi:hypothetical protein